MGRHRTRGRLVAGFLLAIAAFGGVMPALPDSGSAVDSAIARTPKRVVRGMLLAHAVSLAMAVTAPVLTTPASLTSHREGFAFGATRAARTASLRALLSIYLL
jgi:hypothetical protein